MSTEVFENNDVSGTQCCSRCDFCCRVRLGVQFTGRNGYIMICYECMPQFVALIPIRPV